MTSCGDYSSDHLDIKNSSTHFGATDSTKGLRLTSINQIKTIDPNNYPYISHSHKRYFFDLYKPSKLIEHNGLYFFGTTGVDNRKLVGMATVFSKIVDSINPSYRYRFDGHYFFLISNQDPEIPGSYPGHRNTGMDGFVLMLQEMICEDVAYDPMRPTLPLYDNRWKTPVHEFGHSVELTLGIQEMTDQLYLSMGQSPHSENYAWMLEPWFGQGFYLEEWKKAFLAEVFNEQKKFHASCKDIPDVLPDPDPDPDPDPEYNHGALKNLRQDTISPEECLVINEENISMGPCNSSHWELQEQDGWFQIKDKASGHCIAAVGPSKVKVEICGNYSGHYWTKGEQSNHYFQIKNMWQAEKCLKFRSSDNSLSIESCLSSDEYFWKLQGTAPKLSEGSITNLYQETSLQTACIVKASDGSVSMGSCLASRWQMEDQSDGWFFIKDKISGQCLVAYSSGGIRTETCGNYSGHFWKKGSSSGSYFQIKNMWQSEKCLNLTGLNGVINIETCQSIQSQFWSIH